MPVYATGDDHLRLETVPLPHAPLAAAIVGAALLAAGLARLLRR